jgi:Zn-dependent protease with chaperone function
MPTYTGISSEAFRHPLDRQAEEALRSVPGFDLVARNFLEYFYERPQNIYLLGNNIKAGVRQYSTVYGIFRECMRDLDIHPEPTLYVSQNAQVNSYALGQEKPYIVINTGLLDLLNEAEIRTVLAHELGHIKCSHSILIQMAIWAMNAASFIGELTFGIGNLISSGLIYAFYEWRRKAELSADRAAMLVMDDFDTVAATMMKIGGGSQKYMHECSLTEFIDQAKEYQELDTDSLNQIYKFLIYNGGNNVFLTHPFPVERIHHLQNWAASEEYRSIKSGSYRRDDSVGAVDVDVKTNGDRPQSNSDTESLQRQIEELQQEINRIKNRRS